VTVLILVGVSIVLTSGVVYATHTTTVFSGDVLIQEQEPGTGNLKITDGNLDVTDGRLFFSRIGQGFQSQIVLKNDQKQNAIYFKDDDSSTTYIVRLTAPGSNFSLLSL